MEGWRGAFDQTILERGREYFEDGRVSSLVFKTPLEFETTVFGNKPYHVKVQLSECGDLVAGDCECPYFEEDNCKHLAAALFAWEMSESDNSRDNQLLGSDENNTVPELAKRFIQICRFYTGRDNYVEYWEAYRFTREAQNFLNLNVHTLINDQQLAQSFELILKILRIFLDTPMDDDGGIYEFCQCCLENLDEIYQIADAKLRREMYDRITKNLQLPPPKIEYSEPYLETLEKFWSDHFNAPEFYDNKCKLIEQKIQNCMSDNSEEFIARYGLEKWLLSKAKLVEACAKSPSEVEEFYLQNYNYDWVRRRYIDWMIRSKDYQKAFRTLTKLIDECNNDYNCKVYYHQQLAVSEALRDINTQKQCLLQLLRLDDEILENYNKLKKLYPSAEWNKVRKKIILKVPNGYVRLQLFDLENMLPELKSEIAASRDLGLLDDYRKKLASEYPEEILDYYYQFLQEEASCASDRKHYHWLASVLRHLSKLPGGKDVASRIVAEWRKKYSRRRAMMEELERLLLK